MHVWTALLLLASSSHAAHQSLSARRIDTGVELQGLRSKPQVRFAYFQTLEVASRWMAGQEPSEAPMRVPATQQFDAPSGTWSATAETPSPVSWIVLVEDGVQVVRQAVTGSTPGRGSGVLLIVSGDKVLSRADRAGQRAPFGHTSDSSSRSSRRRLLATGDCTLDISGTAHSFTACQSVATGFTVYTALEAGVGGVAVLRIGLEAAASGGWAGFGVSANGDMVGGQVGVAATDPGVPSGATVSGFVLPSTSARRVNAANGTLALTGASAAARPDGTLLATWAVPLEGTVASAQAGPTRFIYAIGPLSEHGVLASHARGGNYPYGDVSINLVAA
ncbi:hypothetical protein ACKKBG_A05225 [Auxenochlorella protothecoides x Auxenochlorella symbiontica]